ncbi:hypothetical protein Tco_0282437 [Tanacetum coccineum]
MKATWPLFCLDQPRQQEEVTNGTEWRGLEDGKTVIIQILASAAICKNGGVTDLVSRAYVIENKVETLTITTFLFPSKKVLLMSSSPRSTITSSEFDMENAFSTMNIHNYTSASSATSGSTSFNSSEDSRDGHHEKQTESIMNYLEEPSFHCIEKMKERFVNDWIIMPRISDLEITLEDIQDHHQLYMKNLMEHTS